MINISLIVELTFYFLFPGPSGEQNQEGESMFEIETSTGSSTPVGCGSQGRSGDCPVERTGYAPARRAAGTPNKAGAAVGVDLWVKDTILLPPYHEKSCIPYKNPAKISSEFLNFLMDFLLF